MREPPNIDGIDLDRELALLFSEEGDLLWWSPAWHPPGSPPVNPDEFLGKRWSEYIHPDDLDSFRFWLLASTAATHQYRFLNQAVGGMMRIWIVKVPCPEGWLCIGHPEGMEHGRSAEPEVSGRMLFSQ